MSRHVRTALLLVVVLVLGPLAIASAAPAARVTVRAHTLPVLSAAPVDFGSGRITGISCPAPGACVAVGNYRRDDGVHSFAETLRRGSWTAARLPVGASRDTTVNSLSCTSITSCVAVGDHLLVETLTASGWSAGNLTDPAGSGNSILVDVDCPQAAACTAVGVAVDGGFDRLYSVAPLAATLTGTSWSTDVVAPYTFRDSLSPDDTRTLGLRAVACTAPRSCVATDGIALDGQRGGAFRQGARAWTYLDPNPPVPSDEYDFTAVSCLFDTICKIAGDHRPQGASEPDLPFIATLNRSSFSYRLPPNIGKAADLDCRTLAACTLVGDRDSASTLSGGQWTKRVLPVPPGGLDPSVSTVSCATSTSCVAAGTYTDSAGLRQPMADTFDGSTWTAAPMAAPPTLVRAGLVHVSCPAATSCTAVGSVVNGRGRPQALVARLDGTTWSTTPLPLPPGSDSAHLTGVSCPTTTWCMAVGYGSAGALVEILSGGTWTVTPVAGANPGEGPDAVSCASRTRCVLVGVNFTTPLVWTGSSFARTTIDTPYALRDVDCVSATVCVGLKSDAIETLRGLTWTDGVSNPDPYLDGRPFELLALDCTSATVCSASGTTDAIDFRGAVGSLAVLSDGVWQQVDGELAFSLLFSGAAGCGRGSCVAVGTSSASDDQPVTASFGAGGYTVTSTGAGPAVRFGGLDGDSCPPAGPCIAVGSGTAPTGAQLPLVETVS